MSISIIDEMKQDENNLPLIREIVSKHKMPDIKAEDLIQTIDTFDSSYEWTPPRRVQIPKPNSNKKRDLYIFNSMDSYFMKLINKVLYDNFSSRIHSNVFSYKKKTRTFDAVSYIAKKMQDTRLFGVKLDISDYFGSVSKQAIQEGINDLDITYDDRYMLRNIFNIKGFYQDGEFHEKHMGIMAGSAISAFFANYLLYDIDEYLSKNMLIYARYSDDMIMFTDDENKLNVTFEQLKYKLSQKGLVLNPNKIKRIDTSKDTIEFLGLTISKNQIDISNDSFVQLKHLVKHIVKTSRGWRSAITKMNKLLYRNIFDVKSEHKSNRMHYIFNNITTDETLKKVDHYVTDRLRAKVTGKNNKANTKVPIQMFEDYGYKSSVQLWNVFKIGIEAYLTEISVLGKSNKPHLYQHHNLFCGFSPVKEFTARSFDALFNLMISNKDNYFLYSGVKLYPEYVNFDLQESAINFSLTPIAKGNELKTNKFYCHVQGKDIIVNIPSNKVSDCAEDDPDNLLIQALIGTYTEEMWHRDDVLSKGNVNAYFRKYKMNDLMQVWKPENIGVYDSYARRFAKLLSYVFFHKVSGNLWRGLNYNQSYVMHSVNGFTVTLKREFIIDKNNY